jgi:uncharacterized protein YqjF (DUF2071 family)
MATLANIDRRQTPEAFRADNPRVWLAGDWLDVVFVHYRVDPEVLQPHVPFPLDLYEGWAYVSLVAFTMNRMRPNRGGAFTEHLFRPIATHQFLNIRTYVKVKGEPGIQFLAEILNNKWSIPLGPVAYSLPYRLGKIAYRRDADVVEGSIRAEKGGIRYRGKAHGPEFVAEEGSLNEFLVERYAAFNAEGGVGKKFRVDHEPWQLREAEVEVLEESLLRAWFPWFAHVTYCAAQVSDGVREVKMGLPKRLRGWKPLLGA